MAPTSDRHDALAEMIGRARWFGGKGRDFTVEGVRRLGTVPPTADRADEPVVVVDLAEVRYADTPADAEPELYQLPLALYTEPQGGLDHAFVGWWEEDDLGWQHAYDATQDKDAMARYLHAFASSSATGAGGAGLAFHRLASAPELDSSIQGTLFSGEQSNSSVLFGDEAVLKVFRKVTPGENPDITTHRVLTEAGSTHVAHLYGWVESDDLHLAMLQQFLRTASDGWELALASVRNLYAEGDLHAEEVGGDFAGEAARLGEALAEVHEQLREAFPTGTLSADTVAADMRRRLSETAAVVPALGASGVRLQERYDALRELADLPVQRVHGDLHLGQTLRTVMGWKLVDFEGEPAKPLAERLLPDTPWRDVAGMLRSFDYAAHALVASASEEDADVLHQRRHRAREWASRNQDAFLAAYTGGRELTPAEQTVLTAYVADKAVYECLYEARNRPAWIEIPLGAIERLTA